jgi:PAS domain S-box-containing protein
MTTGSLTLRQSMSLLDAVDVPLLIYRAGHILWGNQRICDCLHTQREQLASHTLADLFTEASALALPGAIERVIVQGEAATLITAFATAPTKSLRTSIKPAFGDDPESVLLTFVPQPAASPSHSAAARQHELAERNAHLEAFNQRAQQEIEQRKQAQTELSDTLRRTEVLYRTMRLLITSDATKNAMQRVISILPEALNAAGGLLVTFDESTGQVSQYEQNGQTQGWADFWQLVGDAARTQPGMPSFDLLWPRGIQRPLSADRRGAAAAIGARGLLALVRDSSEPAFTQDEMALLVALADQLAIALENDILWQHLQQYSIRLAHLLDERTVELSDERARLQAILDATGEGILYMEDFVLKYANPALCRMLGHSRTELIGKPLKFIRAEGTPPAPDAADAAKLHNAEGWLKENLAVADQRDKAQLRRNDGSSFPAHLTFSVIGAPGVDPVRMVCVVRDVSEELALQEQRARFIDNAAHELRTPLTSLGLRLQLLQRQPQHLAKHMQQLRRAYSNIKQLVDDMLELTRSEKTDTSLNRALTPLQPLLELAVDNTEAEAVSGDTPLVLCDFMTERIPVHVDPQRIRQMLDHLLRDMNNEITPPEQLRLTLDQRQRHERSYLCIMLCNPKRRFPPELLPQQIFEPFSRPRLGDSQGTGIELAIVKRIVQLHGGIIEASNQAEGGSCIHIFLPL